MYDPVNDIVIFATVDKNADGVPDNDDSDADTIPDGAIIFNEALAYAEKNIPGEDILAAVDLHAGNWEPTTLSSRSTIPPPAPSRMSPPRSCR
jgi:hypothetical protein